MKQTNNWDSWVGHNFSSLRFYYRANKRQRKWERELACHVGSRQSDAISVYFYGEQCAQYPDFSWLKKIILLLYFFATFWPRWTVHALAKGKMVVLTEELSILMAWISQKSRFFTAFIHRKPALVYTKLRRGRVCMQNEFCSQHSKEGGAVSAKTFFSSFFWFFYYIFFELMEMLQK